MQITAVSTWFPTDTAPSRGAFVVRDLHAIAAHHDVRLVHLVPPQDDDGSRRTVYEGIDVVRVPMATSSPRDVTRAAAALPTLLAGSDVVHTMAFSSLLPFAVRRPRIPWVHTEHWSALTTPSTLPTPARLALPALSRLLHRPDVVTAVCDFLAEPIRRVRGARPTSIVPCIVEPHAVAPRRSREDGALRLVSTGGLIERKDPLVAVETLAALVERGADAYLEWLGEGPLREATLTRARELGVADRLMLPGSCSSQEVRERLAAADLFFGPTRADNFFVSAAEAIVAGRPVVLGATGGQGEYVTEQIGALVGTQDAEAYAEEILAVDARTRDLPSEEIAAVIGDRFSAARVGEGYAEALEDAVRRRGSRGRPPATAPRPTSDPSKDGARATANGARPVEVVIACHSERRAVDEAVASVLDDADDLATVRVVAHNIDPARIRARLRPQDRERVVLDHVEDAIASPAGPFQQGLDAGTSPFVCLLGSDDVLEPGAIASWLSIMERTHADLVMARLQLDGARTPVPTPPMRPLTVWRSYRGADRLAHGLQDRLIWRSAPLGLLRRETLVERDLRLLPGVAVGEDVDLTTRLALRGKVSVDATGPAYVIRDSAKDRVTFTLRPLSEELAFLSSVLREEYDGAERRAVARKVLRIHVFGAVHYRSDASGWTPGERTELARIVRMLNAWAPGYATDLSRAEAHLLALCADPLSPASALIAASAARRRHGALPTVVPAHLRRALDRDAPLRTLSSSLLASRVPQRP